LCHNTEPGRHRALASSSATLHLCVKQVRAGVNSYRRGAIWLVPGQLSRAGVLESGDESRFCLVGRPASRSSSSRSAVESHTIVSSSGRHGVRYKHLFYSTFIRARREGTTVVLGFGIAVVVRAVSEGPSWPPFRLQASS
jgi:hypothetical protein